LLFSVIGINAQENTSNIMYVFAPNGLRVRNSPNINGEIIGRLQFGEMVEILRENSVTVTIDTLIGKWVYITTNSVEGWVFNGYLIRTFDQEFIETFANSSWTAISQRRNSFTYSFNNYATELIVSSVSVSAYDPEGITAYTLGDGTWKIINYERIPDI